MTDSQYGNLGDQGVGSNSGLSRVHRESARPTQQPATVYEPYDIDKLGDYPAFPEGFVYTCDRSRNR
jgi:hypothetical protein